MKYSEKLIEKVIEALDNADYEVRYYFNVKTQEITYFTDYLNEKPENEEDVIDLSEWIEIDGIETDKKYNLMEEFASKQCGSLKELLYSALKGKGAFRKFKDVLYRFPLEQKKWYEFEHKWLETKAKEFLDWVCKTTHLKN